MQKRFCFHLKVLVMFLSVLISFMTLMTSTFGYAEDVTVVSGVLDDLSRDTTFSEDNFSIASDKPSSLNDLMSVIQVAEGDKGCFYVYTYTAYPNYVFDAQYITMALSEDVDYSRYDLELLDCNVSMTLHKYLVKDFCVKDNDQRYYGISGIYYNSVSDIITDGDASEINPDKPGKPDGTFVPVPGGSLSVDAEYDATFSSSQTVVLRSAVVSTYWIVDGHGDSVSYRTKEIEKLLTISSDDLYCGHIEYPLSAPWDILINSGYNNKSCNSNFIAFKTDIAVEKIYSAKVVCDIVKVSQETNNATGKTDKSQTLTENVENTLTVDDTVKVEDFLHFYTWKRIQNVDDFVSSEELTSEAKEMISGFQWVLRFNETEYTQNQDLISYSVVSEYVENVQILQLGYMSGGQVFNVGVVSDVITPDKIPENDVEATGWRGFRDKLINGYIMPILLVLCVVILLLTLPIWVPFVVTVIKYIFKGVWFILTLPYLLIKRIAKGGKE